MNGDSELGLDCDMKSLYGFEIEPKPVMLSTGRGKQPLALQMEKLVLPARLLVLAKKTKNDNHQISVSQHPRAHHNQVENVRPGRGKAKSTGKGRGRGHVPKHMDITEEVFNSISASSSIQSAYQSDPCFEAKADIFDVDSPADFQGGQQMTHLFGTKISVPNAEPKCEDGLFGRFPVMRTRTSYKAPLDIKSKDEFPDLSAGVSADKTQIVSKPRTVNIENLPASLDRKMFEDVLANYGEVMRLSFQPKKEDNDLLAAVVTMAEENDANYVVECLNGNDIFHPGHQLKASLTVAG